MGTRSAPSTWEHAHAKSASARRPSRKACSAAAVNVAETSRSAISSAHALASRPDPRCRGRSPAAPARHDILPGVHIRGADAERDASRLRPHPSRIKRQPPPPRLRAVKRALSMRDPITRRRSRHEFCDDGLLARFPNLPLRREFARAAHRRRPRRHRRQRGSPPPAAAALPRTPPTMHRTPSAHPHASTCSRTPSKRSDASARTRKRRERATRYVAFDPRRGPRVSRCVELQRTCGHSQGIVIQPHFRLSPPLWCKNTAPSVCIDRKSAMRLDEMKSSPCNLSGLRDRQYLSPSLWCCGARIIALMAAGGAVD